MTARAMHGIYWSLAALQGVGLAVLFQTFTGESIVQLFLVTAAGFAALSLYGYTTPRALSGLGAFVTIGLVGVIAALLVNVSLQSSVLTLVASAIGALVFAGPTAFDTPRLKRDYLPGIKGEAAERAQVWGALRLYLNFVNIFQLPMSLFGQREQQRSSRLLPISQT